MIALPAGYNIRHTVESDHLVVVEAIGRWWETPNRAMLGLLMPGLFFQFFTQTSWIVEDEASEIGAFLIGSRARVVRPVLPRNERPRMHGGAGHHGLVQRTFAGVPQGAGRPQAVVATDGSDGFESSFSRAAAGVMPGHN